MHREAATLQMTAISLPVMGFTHQGHWNLPGHSPIVSEESDVMIHLVSNASTFPGSKNGLLILLVLSMVALILNRYRSKDQPFAKLKPFPKNEPKSEDSELIKLASYQLDPNNLMLIHPLASKRLTHKEGKLLSLFLSQPNVLIERSSILKEVWEDEGFFVARSMDVFISRLRKYLAMDTTLKLENVRGVGYILRYSRST